MMTFFTEINDNDRAKPSLPGSTPVPPSPDLSIGPLLKARRLELGLKHKDISKEIKIKAEYLKAIEDEEFDSLPTPEYLRLFLKTYAVHLGFDAQEIYGVYDTQEMPVKKPEKKEPLKDTPLPSPPLQANLKAIIWVSGVAVVVLAILMVLLFGAGNNDTESVVRNEPADSLRSVESVRTREASPVDSAIDTSAAALPSGMPQQPLLTGYRLQIRCIDSTWIVIQADDDTVYKETLRPGEIRSWVAGSAFRFSLVNYDGVEASINGRFLKPFRQWDRPVQAREVGGYNLEQFLDSTRLAENGGMPLQREGENLR